MSTSILPPKISAAFSPRCGSLSGCGGCRVACGAGVASEAAALAAGSAADEDGFWAGDGHGDEFIG
jgi:hypothetical protein